MRVDHTGRRVEPRVGDPPHTDLAIVERHVLHEPVNGVVGVGGFVGGTTALVGGVLGTHVDKITFRHPGAANVLVDEDVLRARQVLIGTDERLVVVGAVGRDAVRSAVEENGIGGGGGRVLGNV